MRQSHVYASIRECHNENGYSAESECELLHVSRSAYNKWASGRSSRRTAENEQLAVEIEKIHAEHPDKGYRRINVSVKAEGVLPANGQYERIQPTTKKSNAEQ